MLEAGVTNDDPPGTLSRRLNPDRGAEGFRELALEAFHIAVDATPAAPVSRGRMQRCVDQTLGIAHYLPFHPSVALGFALIWGVGLVHPGGDPQRTER